MKTKARIIQLKQAMSSHATRRGRGQLLTVESREKLLVTSGRLASEAVASHRLEFEMQVEVCMTLKRKTREEVFKGVSTSALTISLSEYTEKKKE